MSENLETPEKLPLVMLPGMDGTGRLFEPLVERLGDRPVLVLDLPAAGVDYRALADAIGPRLPERCILLSESFSGPLGIILAHRHPGKITGLILAVTFAHYPLPAALGSLARVLPHGPLVRPLARAMLMNGQKSARVARLLHEALDLLPPSTLSRRLASVLSVDQRPGLKAIRQPVLVLSARQDRLIPAQVGRELAKIAARCKQIELDGPHMLLQMRPDQASAVIAQFCSQMDLVPPVEPQ